MSDPQHERIQAHIETLEKVAAIEPGSSASELAAESAERIKDWWLALQMIATGEGDKAFDADVMRTIAEEALAWKRGAPPDA